MTDTLSLSDKALRAAFSLCEKDEGRSITGEDILVQAWKEDRRAWGLRGYEDQFPDSNKLYTKLDGKDGLVGLGFLRNVGPRTYQMTAAGMSQAGRLGQSDATVQAKIERRLQDAVLRVLDHDAFRQWQRDPMKPNKFRDIGAFWGVAPGTPPRAIRSRLEEIEQILIEAQRALSDQGLKYFVPERGSARRYETTDVARAMEFHKAMKARFAKDLAMLDPGGKY